MTDTATPPTQTKAVSSETSIHKSPRSNSRPVSLPVQLLASKDANGVTDALHALDISDQKGLQSVESSPSLPLSPPVSIDSAWYEQNVQKVVKAQTIARRRLLQPHFNLLLKLHRKRTRVAREIWHSETTYLEGLMTLLALFKMPLLAKAKIPDQMVLTVEQVNTLFINVEQLIEASKKLLKQLQEVVLKWTPHTRVGNIFITNAEALKEVFTPYVDHYDKCNELFIKQKVENKKFQEFLAGVEYKMCDLGLESYLIMPIQRVARYGLLLREYIKQTWQDHDDYSDLQEALKTVDDVARYVNEHKTKMVNFERVKVIQSQIVSMTEDLTAKTDRQYILEGAVTELGKIPITHYLFLFNDVLVWTQQVNKKKYLFRKLNWLSRSTAEAGELNSVKIVTDGWDTKIFTKSREEQNKWIAYIENENYTPINEPQHPARPSVVFLERRKMIQSQLKLAPNSGSAGGSRRGSMKKTPSQEGGASKSPSSSSSSKGSSSSSSKDEKLYHRKARTIDMQQLQKDMEKQAKKLEEHKDKLAKKSSKDKVGGSSRPSSTSFKATTLAPDSLSPELMAQLRKLRPIDDSAGSPTASGSETASPTNVVPSPSSPALTSPSTPSAADSPSRSSSSSSKDKDKDKSKEKSRSRPSRSSTLSAEDAAKLKSGELKPPSDRRSMPRSSTDISGSPSSDIDTKKSGSGSSSSSSSKTSSRSSERSSHRERSSSHSHSSSSSPSTREKTPSSSSPASADSPSPASSSSSSASAKPRPESTILSSSPMPSKPPPEPPKPAPTTETISTAPPSAPVDAPPKQP